MNIYQAPLFLNDLNLISLIVSGANSVHSISQSNSCFIWVLIMSLNIINMMVYKYYRPSRRKSVVSR